MFSCPTCGHQNLPSFSVCARCGAHLAGAINDPIAAMAAEQARSRKRSRVIYSAAAVIGLAALAVFAVRDRMTKAAVGQKLQWLDSWAEKDKLEVGALWNCLTQSNTPLDSFATAGQVQAKVEQAAGVQPKTFAEHLRLECGPMGERVVSVFATSDPVPAEFQPGFEAFKASLPKLKDGIATFAERLDTLVQGGNLASKLQTAGEAWHASQSPTVESVAFEKHFVEVTPGQLAPKNCLVVRLRHGPGRPVIARLQGLTPAGSEQRLYTQADKTASLFWFEPDLDPKTRKPELEVSRIRLISIAAFKEEARRRDYWLELNDLPAPDAADERPRSPLELK